MGLKRLFPQSERKSQVSIGTGDSTPAKKIRIVHGRIAFLLCLFVTAVILGLVAYFSIKGSEESLSSAQYVALTEQYDSIADRALVAALGINIRKRLGAISLSTVFSYMHPDASTWPFVTLPGYEVIAGQLIDTSSGREMAHCPFVAPDQLSEFEDFAFDFFENGHVPPFPNGTGFSSFGKGVWETNLSLNTSDKRSRVTDASTSYDSPNKLIVPILQYSGGAHPILMLNVRYEEVRGKAIDRIIECAQTRSDVGDLAECGLITSILYLAYQDKSAGPGALMLQPIYPANNNTTITGLIASSIIWNELLQDVFSSDVQGIDCILESDTQVYTYTIVDGVAQFIGEGDLHERAYDNFRRTISLTPTEYFSQLSANYTLSLYPSSAFYTVYSTNNAVLVTVGTVCIILLISALFFLYDRCVRHDISAKSDLLDAKRAFVRFVSHEVRTPLNSVCMGLALMQEEIAKSAGCKSVQELDSKAKESDGHLDVASSCAGDIISCFLLSLEIHTNVLRAVSVLNDLLNYDKIEMGTLKLELKVIHLQALVESTVQEFAVAASQKKLALTVDFSPADDALKGEKTNDYYEGPGASHECKSIGDDVRLRQVMRNLVSNALKFTPENGTIRVSAWWVNPGCDKQGQILNNFTLNSGVEHSVPRCGWIEVRVTDSGAGMTAEQVSKVFGAGVQFNANELQDGHGTGLGLHIAKGIMEQHGGTLQVSSLGLGHGSTFTMKIPIYHVPEDNDHSHGDDTGRESDTEKTDYEPLPLKILVVDDAAMNRKLLARILRNHGHQCDEAEDGAIAVGMVKKAMDNSEPYDTVLLDSEMPVMDGQTAAKHIRAMGSDTFIVGVTGNLLPEDVEAFKNTGANAVLPKPFQFSELESFWMEYGVYKVRPASNSLQLPF